jgi:hypothetical protein
MQWQIAKIQKELFQLANQSLILRLSQTPKIATKAVSELEQTMEKAVKTKTPGSCLPGVCVRLF